ncbi:hypothetical protein FPOAC1_003879 [Fusarium poae]|uniref:hypothetical protein n=1 Tax=Fusarium poae TaxID=36050 RepID=UPI001CEA69A7|nr:hypothetical protein FPOAC1_003879 [Fusarium poae]KAG8677851.1 hypothetical protein FPOAC1_003879 [Fusarium poae]
MYSRFFAEITTFTQLLLCRAVISGCSDLIVRNGLDLLSQLWVCMANFTVIRFKLFELELMASEPRDDSWVTGRDSILVQPLQLGFGTARLGIAISHEEIFEVLLGFQPKASLKDLSDVFFDMTSSRLLNNQYSLPSWHVREVHMAMEASEVLGHVLATVDVGGWGNLGRNRRSSSFLEGSQEG